LKPLRQERAGCSIAEPWMRHLYATAVLGLILAATVPAALAQAPPALAPVPRTPKLNLTLEQRHTIRELIKDVSLDHAPSDVRPTVGDPVPQGVALHPVPSVVAEKVPQIKSHKFFIAADQIVLADPKDNVVVEVINLRD